MRSIAIHTFTQLIRRDWAQFKPLYFDRCVDALIWAGLTAFVALYMMPSMGTAADYGMIMIAGNIISWGFHETMGNVGRLVADLEGERSISYYLTLPLPHWALFIRIAITNAIQASVISFMILPISKILFWKAFCLSKFSFIKFFIILILSNIFYGFFSLCLASLTKNMDAINKIWMRVVFPLWFAGGYAFPWGVLYSFSPVAAYIDLLNPLVYPFEGVRNSILGTSTIPFWISCFALIGFTILCGYIGTRQMMKRLDCV